MLSDAELQPCSFTLPTFPSHMFPTLQIELEPKRHWKECGVWKAARNQMPGLRKCLWEFLRTSCEGLQEFCIIVHH